MPPLEPEQYTSAAFAEACRSAGVRRSMSAVGSSADNAAAESFNASLKRKTLKGAKAWPTARQARLDTFRWSGRYNTRRRHSRLGQRSPIAYETALQEPSTTLTQAAQDVSSWAAVDRHVRHRPAVVPVPRGTLSRRTGTCR
ncbi:transposase [Streptomyces sp. TRM66268-LWL]|uniref:Transposase n=1 Tax=Streptomyces polyasparticus TaxID=2767826 RepID=A0ABR7SYU1_9ACTN|nr:transposase [Streptomyces polyasparticus]